MIKESGGGRGEKEVMKESGGGRGEEEVMKESGGGRGEEEVIKESGGGRGEEEVMKERGGWKERGGGRVRVKLKIENAPCLIFCPVLSVLSLGCSDF